MPIESLQNSIPAELAAAAANAQGSQPAPDARDWKNFLIDWRRRLDTDQRKKRNIQTECWQLYRGVEDWKDKQDWQSKITLPKAFNSVKQATNAIMRLLETADMPWSVDSVNPDDKVSAIRGQQIADILKVLLEQGGLFRSFAEGLESGFITGVGVWKIWWGMSPRQRFVLQQQQQPDGSIGRSISREELLEGQLFIRAVDPYNFFWLPGSKFNQWAGTIELIDIPKYELLSLAQQGLFGPDGVKTIKNLAEQRLSNEVNDHPDLRFYEPINMRGASSAGRATGTVQLMEYYGPRLDKDGNILQPYNHTIIANDEELLIDAESPLWHRKPPYVAFSPLLLPFRTEGIGIIEHTRAIDRGLNRLVNMGMDKELFKLMPIFEAFADAYENKEDLDSGITPGKIMWRNRLGQNSEGLRPVVFEGVQQDMISLAGILDRGHQEGSFISEIQQALPRFRGVQTLGEIEMKGAQQTDFLGAMAKDIDEFALKPIIELSMDTMMQFLDTTNDPRIGSILGIGAEYLRGIQLPEILEMIAGDYVVKVSGVTDQIRKAEELQNLIQLMNVIGQNEAWMPALNTSEFLQRILESFRGAIHDTDNLVNDPQTMEAQRQALAQSALTPELLRMMPQIIQQAAEMQRQDSEALTKLGQEQAPAVQQALQQQQQEQSEAAARAKLLEDLAFQAQVAQLRDIAQGFDKKNYSMSQKG